MGLPRTGFGWTVADPSLAGVDEQRLWMPAMVSLPHGRWPWNWIIQREGRTPGRAVHSTDCQLRT
jgi:hypothetical protein